MLWLMAFYALVIFISFAVIGGMVVRWVVNNQSDDDPQRGIPRDPK